MITFTLTKLEIKAALLMAAKKDVRYYLIGALVELRPECVRLVSTDGHAMIAMQVSGHGYEPRDIILPRQILEHVVKAFPKYDGHTFTVDGGQVTSGGLTVSLIDCKFPDWRRVMPRVLCEGEAPVLTVDGEILERAQQAVKLARNTPKMCTMQLSSNGDAYVLRFETGCAVVMGVRSNACEVFPLFNLGE